MKAEPTHTRRTTSLIAAAMLALTTMALFWPATRADYVIWDDDQYVFDNPHIVTGLTWKNAAWAFSEQHFGHWIPITWLSFMADAEFLGHRPRSYHFTNVLLHAVNAALVLLLFRRLGVTLSAAVLGAVLFAWHPLRVESVAWIAERKDVLSACFALLAVLAYTRHAAAPSWKTMTLVTLGMALSLMAKPMAVMLPVVLLLLDDQPFGTVESGGRPNRKAVLRAVAAKAPLWALAFALSLTAYRAMQQNAALTPNLKTPLIERLLEAPQHYLFYLKQTAWPSRLALVYPDVGLSLPGFLMATAVTGGLWAGAFLLRRRVWEPWIGLSWFLILFLPVIGVVRTGVTGTLGDRFTYLPAVGLSLVLAGILRWTRAKRPGAGRIVSGLAVLALLLLAARTHRQLAVWQNTFTVLGPVLARLPDHPIANLNYGVAALKAGREEEAVAHFKRTLAAQPGHPTAWHNMGLILQRQGRLGKARDAFLEAAKRSRHADEDLAYAGRTWIEAGRYGEALRLLDRSLSRYPDSPSLHHALGICLAEQGRAEEAAPHFKTAARDPYLSLAASAEWLRAAYDTGQPDGIDAARAHWQASQRTAPPGYAELARHYFAAWRDGERARAWRYFLRAVEREPANLELLNNVAWMLAVDPASPIPRQTALEWALRAEALSPGHPAILDTVAAAYAANGRYEDALRKIAEALEQAAPSGQAPSIAKLKDRQERYRKRKAWTE